MLPTHSCSHKASSLKASQHVCHLWQWVQSKQHQLGLSKSFSAMPARTPEEWIRVCKHNLQDNLCDARKLTTMLIYLCCCLWLEVCYIFRSRMFFQTTRASDNCNVQFSFQQRVSAQQRAEIITAARSGSSPYVSTNQPPISLGKRILGSFPGEISHNSR